MKKWLGLFVLVFFVSGCVKNSAVKPVQDYLEQYRNHELPVLLSLEELFREEDLLYEQKELYELVMKRQYVELEYQIKDETYYGNEADISVTLEVYDYQNSQNRAKKYLEEHSSLFQKDGQFDTIRYENLQLQYMNEETKRVKYTVVFHTSLKDNHWVLENPDYKIIQNIHGFSVL